jgi:hypothetical protein
MRLRQQTRWKKVSPDEALKGGYDQSLPYHGDRRSASAAWRKERKDADLVILSGAPFAGGTRVEAVVVNGVLLKH